MKRLLPLLLFAPLITGCHQLAGTLMPKDSCLQLSGTARYYQLSTQTVTLPAQITVTYDPRQADTCAGTKESRVRSLRIHRDSFEHPLATIPLVQQGGIWQTVWTVDAATLGLGPGQHRLNIGVSALEYAIGVSALEYADPSVPEQSAVDNFYQVQPGRAADTQLTVTVP
ncbi:hypothetical protein [Deinococcus sp. Marseille-Q6407]|uniref:hypothetical protein n=1 Tax=Deinococcus sp. Marseille-Q6407 TaxID=2969223 RepID=UPI0021BF6267|nr:hypothetical protein [Deinococcus sp. Marseille-Q6407]